jgi:hypothetical protein
MNRDQFYFQIMDVFPDLTAITDTQLEAMAMFIEHCSLSQFEKLKDLDFELSQSTE